VTPAALEDRTAADRDLAARCAAGERPAQRELFSRVKQAVHRTLFRILGANRDLEDVLQDAFLAIFRSIASFRGESSLTTWCCAIATRTAWGYIVRRRPATSSLDLVAEPASPEPAADRVVAARDAACRLYAALDRIDPKMRIAFALAVIDGRSLAEVAELTDASLVAVKTRVWRARRELDRRARKDSILGAYIADLGVGEESSDV
jgi:RNA polymerase sigma-70 factor (ECF subfamily)